MLARRSRDNCCPLRATAISSKMPIRSEAWSTVSLGRKSSSGKSIGADRSPLLVSQVLTEGCSCCPGSRKKWKSGRFSCSSCDDDAFSCCWWSWCRWSFRTDHWKFRCCWWCWCSTRCCCPTVLSCCWSPTAPERTAKSTTPAPISIVSSWGSFSCKPLGGLILGGWMSGTWDEMPGRVWPGLVQRASSLMISAINWGFRFSKARATASASL